MSVHRPLAYLAFAVWVSVCAAAPEFIWQGLLALLGHFSRENVYSIVLIGLILTVFVEPILAPRRGFTSPSGCGCITSTGATRTRRR